MTEGGKEANDDEEKKGGMPGVDMDMNCCDCCSSCCECDCEKMEEESKG